MHDPSRINVVGPLEPFAAAFAEWLVRHGYTPISATFQLYVMAHLSRWLTGEGLNPLALSTEDLERFLAARRRAGYTQYLSPKALQPMLASLREQGLSVIAPPIIHGPMDAALGHYREYLIRERGLAPATVREYVDAVRPFILSRLTADQQTLRWDSLDAAAVIGFVVARTSKQSRGAAKLTVTALRSLLGFLHVEGRITSALAGVVPAVAGWRLTGLPKGLTPAAVHALVASCDRRTRLGRRDYAVLIMLLRLGTRAGELAALTLEDINWRTGTIRIRGKGHQMESLPLPADVGEAIAVYVRRARPATATERTVFVRYRAPHDRLSTGGVTQIVAAAARRAGLGVIYAHRLRHTAATQLLRAGAPLPEIGQLLRHRRALTTAIYAKVDRAALRTIARPWPGGVA
jgi:site-specific recombinase XerD